MHRWGKYGSVKFPHFTRVALIFGTASGAHAPFLLAFWILLHSWLWKEEVQKINTVLWTLQDSDRMPVWELQEHRRGDFWLMGILLWANDQDPSCILCHIHIFPNPLAPYTQLPRWEHELWGLGIVRCLVWYSDVGSKVWIWTNHTLVVHLNYVFLLPFVPKVR